MKTEEELSQRKKCIKLVGSLVSMLLTLVVLFLSSMAWFSSNRNVTARNMTIQTAGMPNLRVESVETHDADAGTHMDIGDVSVNYPNNLLTLQSSSSQKISPGDHGSFMFYLTLLQNGGTYTVHITPSTLVGYYDANGLQNGYRDENALGKESALPYMKGHILLFRQYTDGVYSGWMNPYEGIDVELTGNVETEFTVYWVWVVSYYMMDTGSRVIAPGDVTDIQGYYTENDTYTVNLFDLRGGNLDAETTFTELSHYYDFADERIGRYVNRFYFQLLFE